MTMPELPEPNESPVVFECAGERLIGVVSMPNQPTDTGVLILVGGRQYRAGSHRVITASECFSGHVQQRRTCD